ncbi:MAG: TonB-dependent receptor, partial [Saprospiraceae bacterium]|nr:TonB-dependent receptor [Saprospiraceae bacterium]
MKNTLTLSLVLAFYSLYARPDISISGKVLDESGNPVAYATIVLNQVSDSTMLKADVSNIDGEYVFDNIPAGQYFIQITYVGYKSHTTDRINFDGKNDFQVPTINLNIQAENLAEVVVKSTRSLVEVHPDKTVFNVDGSVNAVGNSALELLRKSPGVVVDNNENLLLQGKNGVQIYIDGKRSPLSGNDLANYLKSMQSTEIDAIEIITNPSAKYDAEGNAGIINIRLKKDQNLGFNGSTNLGYRYGKTSKYSAGGNVNYRDKDFNTFGSYNLYRGQNRNNFFLYREQGGNSYDQNNLNFNSGMSHSFRLGTDLFLNKKNTLGFLLSGNVNDEDNTSDSHTDIANLMNRNIDSFLVASNDILQDRNNLNLNLNYAYNSGDGKTLNIDLDYGSYRNNSTSLQPNRYLAADGKTLLFERTFSNVTPTDIDIYTAKVDFETKLFKGNLALGAKTSWVTTDNTFDNFDIIEGEYIKNLDRSNNFVYQENVNAAYSSWQKKLGDKFNLMLGLRMEHTHSMGDLTSSQNNNDQVVERDYLDVFPSGGITYQANDNNSIRINYSRRIDRPNYQDLNPFEFKLDELTFQRGNP